MSTRMTPETLVGTELAGARGKFRITQYLASGGLAHVYLARPQAAAPGEGQEVALKVLRPEIEERRDAVTRFEREALAALRVRHENVIAVLGDVERQGGLTFFYVEHLVGVDLADLLSSQKKLSTRRASSTATSSPRTSSWCTPATGARSRSSSTSGRPGSRATPRPVHTTAASR
jgi:serine/threonine protein kinase